MTYKRNVWKTFGVEGRFHHCGEPLLLVPIPQLVAGDLAEAHDDGVHIGLQCRILQDVFHDPLGLAVAGAERHCGVIQGRFECWRRAVVVCAWRQYV